MSGPSNFDLESLRQEILKELRDNVRQTCRGVLAEMLGERSREREDDMETVLTDLPKQELQPPAGDFEQPEWAKEMTKMRSQLQLLMKDKGLDAAMDYDDMDLVKEEPLPPKYRFPDIKKCDGTDDPHLHLR